MADYIDKQELLAETLASQANGNVPTERFCSMINEMAERFMHSAKYSRINEFDKAEMRTACLLKCIKSIKNVKAGEFEGRRSNVFSYFTRAIETTIWDCITKRRRYDDLMTELRQATLGKYGQVEQGVNYD